MLRKNKKQWIKKPTKKKNHSNFLNYNQSPFINTKKSPTSGRFFFNLIIYYCLTILPILRRILLFNIL
jgi:hypothetical protein